MSPRCRSVAVMVLCGALWGSAFAALTPAERRIVAAVDADEPRAVTLLEMLVNQNSGTRNIQGVTRVADMLRPEFEALGFQVHWQPMGAVQRAGHLIAVHSGRKGGLQVLLIGHLDTVFEANSPFQRFERRGDHANGPGAEDDKGGIAVIVTALRAMQSAGSLRTANIEVVLTGDEESVGEPIAIARADLIEAGRHADVALDFEGLARVDGTDMGSIARRSADSYRISAQGRSAHSSGIFSADVGDGAIFEIARIIAAFRSELPEPNLTFNIGLLAGGATAVLDANEAGAQATGKTNIVPGVAVATGDFRTLSAAQAERVRRRMLAIVSQHAPGTDAAIEFHEGYPPMPPTPGNHALLDRLNAINAELGLPEMPVLDPLKRGAGDISFVAADVDGLVGLGLASVGDHTPEETADLGSLSRQAKRAALLITRLCRENSRKPLPHR
jgi:glutamate carboxypeptidase